MNAAAALESCVRGGGVAVFPSDTVYGLACDPGDAGAIERLYALKRRPPERAAAVMFFAVEAALGALPELGPRTTAALRRLLPGGLTALVPNPERRFGAACAADRTTLGLRVPDIPLLAGVSTPVLQSSANLSGGADPRRLSDVADQILDGADLAIDGGELPGVASTVVDLRRFEVEGTWQVLRRGAVTERTLASGLARQ